MRGGGGVVGGSSALVTFVICVLLESFYDVLLRSARALL
jgi:hypothetical protein